MDELRHASSSSSPRRSAWPVPLLLRLPGRALFRALGRLRHRPRRQDAGRRLRRRRAACAARHRQRLARPRWRRSPISVAFALIHGFASITQRGNQIVSGVAINFLASGLTVVGNAWFGQGGRTPQLDNTARFTNIDLPFVDALRGVPILGPIYAEPDLRPQHPRLYRLPGRAGDLVDPLSARASACACAPSAKIRPPSTPPASRWPGCAIAR